MTDTIVQCPHCGMEELESNLSHTQWTTCPECEELVEEFPVVKEEPFSGEWGREGKQEELEKLSRERLIELASQGTVMIKCPECWHTWLAGFASGHNIDRECPDCDHEFRTAH